MTVHPPPGRAGRLWLVERIALARRAAELLDQKRQMLRAVEQSMRARLQQAEERWHARAATAQDALRRVAILDGERVLALAGGRTRPASVAIDWQTAMGVRYPDTATIELPPADETLGLGSGTTLRNASQAHREATAAAAEVAVSRMAYRRVATELAATVRRLRAIELRSLPELEQRLAELELALDESERAEIVRIRWAARQTD